MNIIVAPEYTQNIWIPGSGVKKPTKKDAMSVTVVKVIETEAPEYAAANLSGTDF